MFTLLYNPYLVKWFTRGEGGVKIGQNLVHVVCECPLSKKVREMIITFPTRKKTPDIWQKISCNLTNFFFVHCGKQSRWWLDSPTKYKSSAKLSSSILEDIKSLTEPTLAYFGYWDKYVSYIVHISNIGSREMRSILYWHPPFFVKEIMIFGKVIWGLSHIT